MRNRKVDSIFYRRRRAIGALLCTLVVWSASPPIQAAVSPQAQAESNPHETIVRSVESVGMTVSDMDRSVGFYSRVLSFEKISDAELGGSDYEHLEGVFGLRMRVVRMQLVYRFSD